MFAERFKSLRISKGLNQRDTAAALNVSNGTIGNYETGARVPDPPMLAFIADYFGTTVDYLLGRTDDSSPVDRSEIPGLFPVKKKKFPVLGKVACGEPIFAEEDRETFIMASEDIDADFCLIAQGDSMTGAHIESGDVIFIKSMPVVPSGKIAVVLIGDEATVKYIDYRPESATLILTPANPAYRTQIYTGEDLNSIRVIGQAVVLQKNLA